MKKKSKKPSQNGTAKKKLHITNTSVSVHEEYPHFRYYFKSKHPALITAEYSDSEYNYRKVMHGDRDGRHLNEIVKPNPDKKDKTPMYISRRVRHDKKNNFGKKYPWKYPKK